MTEYKIFDTRDAAMSARKNASLTSTQMRVRYTTLRDFFHDMWDVFGDERTEVPASLRVACVYSLLGRFGFQVDSGTANLISGFIKEYSVFIEKAPANDAFSTVKLSQTEKSVLDLTREYLSIIQNLGYIEPTQVAFALKDDVSRFTIDLSSATSISSAFSAVLKHGSAMSECDEISQKIDSNVAVECHVCAGSTATTFSILRSIEDATKSETSCSSVALLCANPAKMYSDLADVLHARHLAIGCKAKVSFADTGFGRCFLAFTKLVQSTTQTTAIEAATDFLYSSFTHCDIEKAAEFNSRMRSDRTLTSDDIIAMLADYNSCAALFYELFFDASAPCCAGQAMQSTSRATAMSSLKAKVALISNPIDCILNQKALGLIESLLEFASHFDLSMQDVCDLSIDASFAVEFADENFANADCYIEILPLNYAAAMASKSYDMVIINDICDTSFNARKRSTATDALADKLGVSVAEDPIFKARTAFSHACRAARHWLAFIWPKLDASGKDTYASFVFDEFLADNFAPVNAAMVSKTADGSSFPRRDADICASAMRIHVVFENDFVTGVGRCFAPTTALESFPKFKRGDVLDLDLQECLAHAGAQGKPVLSASAIENYISCPYMWFMQNLVSLRTPDEEFGALERGNFVHRIMEVLIERAQDAPYRAARLDEIPEEDLSALFSQVFDDVLDEQRTQKPGSGRYVCVSKADLLETSKLKHSLRANIDLQNIIPKGFIPSGEEYTIDPTKSLQPVTYGGAAIRGKVDRFDIDTQTGRFFILDYKGGISKHAAGSASFKPSTDDLSRFDANVLPRHVQALIYAQTLYRMLQEYSADEQCSTPTPVAALYASYSAKSKSRFLNGSASASDADLIEVIPKDAQVAGDFKEFLNKVEDVVAQYIQRLLCSDIVPRPKFDDSCTFCPYVLCERRH